MRGGAAALVAAALALAPAAWGEDQPAPATAVPIPAPVPIPAEGDDEELAPWPDAPEGAEVVEASPAPEPAPPPPAPDPIRLLLSFDAYYTSAGLYVPISREPTPHLGERGELEAYWALLPRSVLPQFAVLEASINPLPCLGLLARQEPRVYDRAQVSKDLNLIHAATAGFEEPFALSAFIGNVADYGTPGKPEILGRGYLGTVISAGLYHLKDDRAIDDPWLEIEVKLKGDRRSPLRKHSWSFRAGVKLHDSPYITDVVFAGLRRSRVDYEDSGSLLANSGIEYRFDLSLGGTPLRHFFLVDKKWPLQRPRLALVLGAGFIWEAGAAYRGVLDDGRGQAFTVLIRPNLEF